MEETIITVPEYARETLKKLRMEIHSHEEIEKNTDKIKVVNDSVQFYGNPEQLKHLMVFFSMIKDGK